MSESPNGSNIPIVDSAGNNWTLVPSTSSGMQIAMNGIIQPLTANVVLLLYWNHVLYQQNAAGGWWKWTNNAWANATDPRGTPPTPTTSESTQGTNLTSTTGTIYDANLVKWTLVSSANSGLQIAQNGTVIPLTANVVLLLYWNRVVYQQNSTGNWWSYTNNTWNSTTDPRVPPIPIPVSTTGDVVVNLGALTGQSVPKELWGFGSGALIDNGFAYAANPTFQASAKALNISFLRLMANSGGWQNTVFANPNSPNWSWFDNWFNNYATFFNPANKFSLAVGPTESGPSLSASQWATCAVAAAQYFKNKGLECFYWEVGNEPDGGYASGPDYINIFNAMADALHGFNANYKVCGPVFGYLGGFSLNSWAQGCGAKADLIDIHYYGTGKSLDNATMYSLALNQSMNVMNARSSVQGTPCANKPIYVSEWNASWSSNPAQQGIAGALFNALALQQGLDSDSNFVQACNWDLVSDGDFGSIAGGGTGLNHINPAGYYLGMGGTVMGGNRVKATNNVGGNLKVLATVNGKKFAIQLINYDLTGSRTISVGISGGTPSGVTRWEISPNYLSGTTSSPNLASVPLPSQSVVVLSGSF